MPTTPSLSRERQRLFRTILVLIPLVFLFLFEAALRVIDYGGNLDLFVTGPGRLNSHYVCNRNVARRYFVGIKQVPTPMNDFFQKQKPANGYRVFVLGGSTAAGYPYGANLMFSRILQSRLEKAMPDKTIEMVNVAMSAINSYTLLDFVDEILKQEPDVILIYAGHNEYYGALGAASMINFGRNRAFVLAYLKLTRYKTFLAIRNLIFKIKTLVRKSRVAPTATLMERMATRQLIPLNSDLYQIGVEQFSGNMRAILTKTKKRNVPIVLSELVSNLSDQAPFISTNEPEPAKAVYQSALILKKQGRYNLAQKEFAKARDLDALRFRAPSEFNDIIHDLGEQFDAPIVAMDSAFRAASPHGLIGDTLMIDHLHPTIKGYFIMADAFFSEMTKAGLVPHSTPQIPLSQLQRAWGYSRIDSLYGDLSIRVLKGGWPFKPHSAQNTALDDFEPRDFVQEIAKRVVKYDNVSIRQGHEILADHFAKSGDQDSALQEYKALVALNSWSAMPYLKISEMLVKTKKFSPVPDLIQKSLLFDESPLPYILLGEAYNGLGRYHNAIAAFEQAQRLGAAKDDLHILVGLLRAYSATGQTEKEKEIGALLDKSLPPKKAPGGIDQLLQKAKNLISAKKYQQAKILLEESLAHQETSRSLLLLGQICLQQRETPQAVAYLEKAHRLDPTQPLILYNLSIALIQQQEYERARASLQQIDKIAPNFGDPYDLKAKLNAVLEKQ